MMREEYQKKYDMILSAEESFARAVALGIWVKRPLTAWHFLLPGMFIFDLIRRTSEIKRYSTLYLFPRKLALDVAFAASQGEDMKRGLSEAEEEVRGWLTSLQLYSARLLRGHREQIRVLIDHYSKLLKAMGNSYHSLIRNVYGSREHYDVFLDQLASAEEEVDQSIAEIKGEYQNIWDRLRAERVQVEALRKKEVNKIFSKMGWLNNGKDSAQGSGYEV